MTRSEMNGLKPGDLVRHKSSGDAMIVHQHYGNRVLLVRTVDLTNPTEWNRVNPDGSIKAAGEA